MRSALICISVAAIVTSLCLSACTHLEVQHVDEKNPIPRSGAIPYVLPTKTIELTTTYVLDNCTTTKQSGQPGVYLEASVTAKVASSNRPDPEHRYFIRYEKLRSWTKETAITLDSHPNKTLKSINVTSNDQTAAIAGAIVTSAVKIGTLVPVSVIRKEDQQCNEATLKHLLMVQTNKDELTKLATTKTADKEGTAARIAKLQAEINQIVKEHLTTTVVQTWTPQLEDLKPWGGTHLDMAQITLNPSLGVNKWLTDAGRKSFNASAGKVAVIHVVAAVPRWDRATQPQTANGLTEGLVVRNAAIGTLYICSGPCPEPRHEGMLLDTVQSVTSLAFPQFGHIMVVPLHNGFMQNSVLDVALSEDGVITKLGVHDTSTVASGLDSLGKGMDSVTAAQETKAKAAAEAQAAQQSQIKNANKNLAECLEAQATILKNGGTPIGSCQ